VKRVAQVRRSPARTRPSGGSKVRSQKGFDRVSLWT
jgi:hypothetical protein